VSQSSNAEEANPDNEDAEEWEEEEEEEQDLCLLSPEDREGSSFQTCSPVLL
jgi:hypothetical protein